MRIKKQSALSTHYRMHHFWVLLIILFFNQNCISIQKENCIPTSLKEFEYSAQRKVLLVVSHQDDEVFILSRIFKHLDAGAEVRVIWTTSSKFKGEKYMQLRLSESKTAMKKIGIPSKNLIFLNHPDSESYKYIPQILEKLKKNMNDFKPNIIYVQAYEGGHIDHDVSHFCTIEAVRRLKIKPIIFEFPLYSAYNSGPLPFRIRSIHPGLNTECRKLSKDEYKRVMAIWNIYKSQHSQFGLFMSISIGAKDTFGYEFVRKLPKYDYYKPPFNMKVAYEKFLKAKFKDYLEAIEMIKRN